MNRGKPAAVQAVAPMATFSSEPGPLGETALEGPTRELAAATQALGAKVESLRAVVESARASRLSPEDAGAPADGGEPEDPEVLDAIERRLAHVERWFVDDEHEARPEVDLAQARNFLHGARTSLDQLSVALEALLDGVRPPDNVPPLSGIKELYLILSGDYEMSGHFQSDRVSLANVTCATMASITANALNKRVMNTFQLYPQWWSPIVTVEDFNTLQDVRWITLGGVGELPTVGEGAAYIEVTWDDSVEQDAFVKKGGYLGITIEAIDRDDTAHLQAAPRALAQAAWLTLSKAIASLFTHSGTGGLGPDLEDGKALFHADHANYGSSALSWSAWNATRQLMRDQTELNSGEPLGALTAPRFLLVPNELEVTALQILASQGEPGTADNDINPWAGGSTRDAVLAAARSHVIVVDFWTDANNWAAISDPRLYPSIGLGFRYGRTPEVISLASPTTGLMFSNDTMPIKVRFFYALGAIDYRGMYLHAV